MRKNIEKIFATAGVIVATVMIIILVVTAFGGIDFKEFENSLVRGLFIALGILYIVLACVSLTMLFVSDDVVKEITLRSEQEGASRATVGVIRKLVKETCSGVDGVKSGKVALVSNEYGVRLKVSVKITDKDVVETETYLRTMLEEVFMGALGFKFHAIEIKITALQPAFKVSQADVTAKVEEILAAGKPEEDEAVSEEELGAEEIISEDVTGSEEVEAEEAVEAEAEQTADVEDVATEEAVAPEADATELEAVEAVEEKTENTDIEG